MNVAGYIRKRMAPPAEEEILSGVAPSSGPLVLDRSRPTEETNFGFYLAGLMAFNQQINLATDFNRIVDLVIRTTVDLLHLSYAALLVLQEDDLFVLKNSFKIPGSKRTLTPALLQALPAQLIYHRAIFRDEPLVIARTARTRTRLSETQAFDLRRDQSICLYPLRVGCDPIGILLLGELRTGSHNPFHEWNLHLASMLCQQAVSAMQRINTLREVENHPTGVVAALTRVIEANDSETSLHSERLVWYSRLLARRLGLPDEETQRLNWAAALHDIGKIAIPHEVLHKPGPLTQSEWEQIKTHPDVGAAIISSVPGLTDVAELVRSHHENFDGSGYPLGLSKTQIPLGARIISVVDSFVAMTEGRIYQTARSPEAAVQELRRCAGQKYDPHIVKEFMEVLQNDLPLAAG